MSSVSGTPAYRSHLVWRRLPGDRAVRYFCLESLSTGLFHVQNADFFSMPVDIDLLDHNERQAAELFIEIDPAERSAGFVSLQKAIDAHDADFADMSFPD